MARDYPLAAMRAEQSQVIIPSYCSRPRRLHQDYAFIPGGANNCFTGGCIIKADTIVPLERSVWY